MSTADEVIAIVRGADTHARGNAALQEKLEKFWFGVLWGEGPGDQREETTEVRVARYLCSLLDIPVLPELEKRVVLDTPERLRSWRRLKSEQEILIMKELSKVDIQKILFLPGKR